MCSWKVQHWQLAGLCSSIKIQLEQRQWWDAPFFPFFFFLPAFPLSAPISVQCGIISLHSRIKIYLKRVKRFSGRHYPNNPDVIASFLCKHIHTLLHNHNRVEAMVFHGRKLQEYPQFRVRYLNSAGFTTVTGIAVSVFQLFLLANIFNFQCLKIGIWIHTLITKVCWNL